jgi:acyl carrier protein
MEIVTGPMTEQEIRGEIRKLIASVSEHSPEEIGDTASFTDDLGVDSLMAMEVMVTLDKIFGIDIPEEEFTRARNVNDAVEMVQRYLPRQDVLARAV